MQTQLTNVITTVKNMVINPVETAEKFKAAPLTPKEMLINYGAPIIVLASVATFILSIVFDSDSSSIGAELNTMIIKTILGVAMLFIWAGIFNFVAKSFDGTPNFNVAFTGITLSIIPYIASTIIGGIPQLGFLITLIGLIASVYTIYIMHKVLSSFMAIPKEKAVIYSVVSIVAGIIVSIIIFALAIPFAI